jgi:hypothetical protein
VTHAPDARPLVTVVTATIGRPTLARSLQSVSRAAAVLGHPVVHLLVVDGPQFSEAVNAILSAQPRATLSHVQVLFLPSNTGRKGSLCRLLGSFLAGSDYVSFLDDDNWYRDDHLQRCHDLLQGDPTIQWAHSAVWVVSEDAGDCPTPPGMPDLCESLGLLRSAYYLPFEHITDTNCFFLRANVAKHVAFHWQRDVLRDSLVIDDRLVYWALLDTFPRHAFLFEPTVFYTPNSPAHLAMFRTGNSKIGERVRKHLGKTLVFRPSRAKVLLLRCLRALRNSIIRRTSQRGKRWDA